MAESGRARSDRGEKTNAQWPRVLADESVERLRQGRTGTRPEGSLKLLTKSSDRRWESPAGRSKDSTAHEDHPTGQHVSRIVRRPTTTLASCRAGSRNSRIQATRSRWHDGRAIRRRACPSRPPERRGLTTPGYSFDELDPRAASATRSCIPESGLDVPSGAGFYRRVCNVSPGYP